MGGRTWANNRAVSWLRDEELVDDQAAEAFLAAHPDPVIP